MTVNNEDRLREGQTTQKALNGIGTAC